jgi:xanthine phosphoribosyltransferase
MKELREAILKQGFGIGDDIVKVDMLLNHRLDIALLTNIGHAFHDAFADERVDMILTVEASGIAMAITTAQAFGNVPVIFAKKSGTTSTLNSDVYEAKVYSFTHHTENYIRIAKSYLPRDAHVLIVDDFLANGEAAEGLAETKATAWYRLRRSRALKTASCAWRIPKRLDGRAAGWYAERSEGRRLSPETKNMMKRS